MQSCLALRFLVKRENDGARGRLINIYFLSHIGLRLACMWTSRKTSARLKITFVDMTYPKGWTGSLPLCPLIFSCIYATVYHKRPNKKCTIYAVVTLNRPFLVMLIYSKRFHVLTEVLCEVILNCWWVNTEELRS